MLGVLALPVMLKEGYAPSLATGVVAASGTLGILIPPSIMLVVLGFMLQVSVGDLFKAAFVPGLRRASTHRPCWRHSPARIDRGRGARAELTRDPLCASGYVRSLKP